MLLCCSCASASFTSRDPSSLSVDSLRDNVVYWKTKRKINNDLLVDSLDSKIYDLLSLIDCDPIRSPAPETIYYEESRWIEVVPCLLTFVLSGIVTSISCTFSARSSLLQILRNSSRRHSVLLLLSLSSLTNLSLLFGFCAVCMLSYRCLQMEWWAAMTVVAIPSQPALSVDLTVCCSH